MNKKTSKWYCNSFVDIYNLLVYENMAENTPTCEDIAVSVI